MNLKEMMKSRGLTYQAMAEKMKISVTSVSQIINGNPKADTLQKVADAFGCQRWELFADEMTEADVLQHFAAVIEREVEHRVAASAAPSSTPVAHPSSPPSAPSVPQSTNELPFAATASPEPEVQAEEARVLRFNYDCPHCGKGVRISIEKV